MSKGMYCSASQTMESASSASVLAGTVIFFTMTALPESDAATSLPLRRLPSNRRRIASATAVPSMIAPSTMLSGGTGSTPQPTTFQAPLPAGPSSTALTSLEAMSRATTGGTRRIRVSNAMFLAVRSMSEPGARSARGMTVRPSPEQPKYVQKWNRLETSGTVVSDRSDQPPTDL